jgi:hypothetical protein
MHKKFCPFPTTFRTVGRWPLVTSERPPSILPVFHAIPVTALTPTEFSMISALVAVRTLFPFILHPFSRLVAACGCAASFLWALPADPAASVSVRGQQSLLDRQSRVAHCRSHRVGHPRWCLRDGRRPLDLEEMTHAPFSGTTRRRRHFIRPGVPRVF